MHMYILALLLAENTKEGLFWDQENGRDVLYTAKGLKDNIEVEFQ